MINVLEPEITPDDAELVRQSLLDGWVSWHGPYYKRFAEGLEEYLGLRELGKRVVLTSSGTTALHLAYVLSGAECVLIPDLTYVATLNTIIQEKIPAYIFSVNQETWNLDIDRLVDEDMGTTNLVTVDLYGNPFDFNECFKRYIYNNDIVVIEDACESLGAKDEQGRFTGTRGDYGVFSFFANKVITCGEGGALVVPEIEYKKAFGLASHFPGGVAYKHPEPGFNYRMTHMSACLGYSQLQRLDENLQKKRFIYNYYKENLSGVIGEQKINGESSHWISTFLFKPRELKNIMRRLDENEIGYRRIFTPMSKLSFSHYSFEVEYWGNLAVSNRIFARGLCLPSSVSLTEQDLKYICEAVNG